MSGNKADRKKEREMEKAIKKEREKKPYLYITIAELLILIVGIIWILAAKNPTYIFDSSEKLLVNTEKGETKGNISDITVYEHQKVMTPYVPLTKGVYRVTILYEGNSDAQVFFDTRQGSIDRFVADDFITLQKERNRISYRVWANDNMEEVRVNVSPVDGKIQVNRVLIAPDGCSGIYRMIRLFLKLLVINIAAAAICMRKKIKKYWITIVAVAFITFLSSLGVTARYLTDGYDLQFHLFRIAGIAKAITSGQFPVRVQPDWLNGWGYAVSAMYGDLMLLFPAGMYLLGFDLQTAYKTYIILVNLLTTLAAVHCFSKFAKDKMIGLVVSAMYVLAPYRLMCIYTRTAVGEYTAALFYPMILLGFWYAFSDKIDKKSYGRRLLIPVLGFTGLIQTHVLSCYMIAVCLVVLLLIEIKKVFRKKTLIYLSKMLGYTIVINLSFLIPFLRFSFEDLKISNRNPNMDDRFAAWGVSLVEIFTHDANSYPGFDWEYLRSLSNRFSMPLSTAFLLIFVGALVLVYTKEFKGKRQLIISMALAVFAGSMTLYTFPYSGFKKLLPKIAGVASAINLPFRFLGIATLFLAITTSLTYRYGKKFISEKWMMIMIAAFLVLTYDQSVGLINNTMYNGTCVVYRTEEKLDDCDVVGGEYLYQDAGVDYIKEHSLPISQGTNWHNYTKNGLDMYLECETAAGGYIEFPALNYPGYVARDKNGQKLEMVSGDNHAIRVLLPQEYQGSISVKYQGLLMWHIFDAISLAGLFFFLWKEQYIRIPMKRGVRNENSAEEKSSVEEKNCISPNKSV